MKTLTPIAALALICSLAVGCASTGEDENYKVLDDNPDTLRDGPKDPSSRFQSYAGDVKTIRLVNVGDSPATHTTTSKPTASQDATDAAEHKSGDDLIPTDAVEPAPAANILDRSNWPRITVHAADGTVTHNPYYWKDCPIDETYVDVLGPASIEGRLEAALAHPHAGGYSKQNVLGLFVQPLKVGADIVLLPYYLVKDCPLSDAHSPE